MTTYYARVEYTYTSGDSNIFTIPFSYIKEEHINVLINDVITRNYVFNSTSQIQINDTLTAGDKIVIARNTPIDERLVNFTNTSILSKENQNLSAQQTFDAVQEIYDNNVVFEIHVNENIDDIQDQVDEANETANEALDNSNTAINTANSATSTANTALSNSQTAINTANTASQTAAQAEQEASQAVTTANNAKDIAEAASDKVDEFGEDIEVVKEAAEKINELEEAVNTAVQKAGEATAAAQSASSDATTATAAAQTATTQAEEAKAKVGDLADLTTTAKTTVVAAINEVNAKPTVASLSGLTDVSLTSLTDKDILSYNSTTQKWENIEQSSGGTGLLAGQTIFSLDPIVNAGLHLLDGTELQVGGAYDDFITNYIAPLYTAHPERFKTEAQWQAIFAEKGICDYYVYTAGTSVRLPKLGNKLYDTSIDFTDVAVIGTGMSLGLTNGTVNGGLKEYNGELATDSALYGSNVGVTGSGHTPADSKAWGVTSDATKSGIIAKTSNFNAEATTGYWYIVVSTVTKTDIEVDIDEVMTDLNNKVDVSSLSEINPMIVSYVNGTEGYNIWANGYCEQWGHEPNGANAEVTISLLKTFKDANYQAFKTNNFYLTNNATWQWINIYTKTVNSFKTYNANQTTNGSGFDWKVCGYLAEGEY